MNEQDQYAIWGGRERDDEEWPYEFLLYTIMKYPDAPRISQQIIYEIEKQYGEKVCVTSLFFSPVSIFFSSTQLALEAKLRYLS